MAETIQVRNGNKYLDIPADAVDRYIAKGYDVVDENGNVVVKSIPNDVNVLRAEYSKQLATIKRLEEENARLKEELKNSQSKPVAKPSPVVEETPVESIEVQEPTTRRRSRKN